MEPRKRLLILRPQGQEKVWQEKIAEKHAVCLHLPVVKIHHLLQEDELLERLAQYTPFSAMIVVSSNAVSHYHQSFSHWVKTQKNMKVLAIGEATAQILKEKNIMVDWSPKISSSEGLLTEYPWHTLPSQSTVLLLAGKGGRTLVYEKLQELQFKPVKIETYERQIINVTSEEVEALLNPFPDVIIISSIEIFDAFFHLVQKYSFLKEQFFPQESIAIREKARQSIVEIPVVVISPRIAEAVQKQGFVHVICSDSTSFESIWLACEQAFLLKR